MTTLINYRTGQKGTTLANFLSFGDTVVTESTGASVMIQGTERMKWWFYHGVYDKLRAHGYVYPGDLPPPTITWEQQRRWFEDDAIADIAYEGMVQELQGNTTPFVSMQHLPMLRRHHIADLRQRGHMVWGITTDPKRVRQIELENHFKTADRPYITEPHKLAIQQYLASKGIPCPDGRPEKEIDAYCAERDLSPTDENRIVVMEKLIAMSNRPDRAVGHTLISCNALYRQLAIPTVDYDELFYPPYDGLRKLKADADVDAWHEMVSKTWLPPKIDMFGRTWDTKACGYDHTTPSSTDMAQIEQDFQSWIMDVLDVPHPALNGNSPCPFARQAWTKGRYKLTKVVDLRDDLWRDLKDWPTECDLCIHVFDITQPIDPNWLSNTVRQLNHDLLLPAGYIALEGHPDIPEAILDCDMNQGKYAYVVLQPLDKLRRAKSMLEGKGYYDNWPDDMMANIVAVRDGQGGTV